ncbi:ELWxxDGT repeat protein [Archangium lansingense]|uniref:ELWxxDGT repeat protein n=1 Tax=Archangium lansingense TaxID=2995310 RepID=UPI003B7D7D14
MSAPVLEPEVSAAWKTPRVELGPAFLVKDILPPEAQPPGAGVEGPGPMRLVDFEGRVYFTVTSPLLVETTLWRSDGTAPGTVPLLTVPESSPFSTSGIRELTVAEDRLFFLVGGAAGDEELWVSDGTGPGTRRLRGFSFPLGLTAVGDTLFLFDFALGRPQELWKSDGTVSGTVLVRSFGSGFSVSSLATAAGGKLFFLVSDVEHGGELWVSNGTASGTRLVEDIFPGPTSAEPSDLTEAGGELYFSAQDPEHGRELWKSDGTRKGTRLVADLSPGAASSDVNVLTENDHRLYFTLGAPAGVSGLLLYKVRVDGSCHHRPVRVAHIPDDFVNDPDFSPPVVTQATATGGKLFFIVEYLFLADTPLEVQLWVTNGTDPGTKPLSDALFAREFLPSASLAPVGDGRVVFSAFDGEHGVEPWVSDGTPRGTRLLQDLVPGSGSSFPLELTHSDGFIFFVANTPETGNELWAIPLRPRSHRTAGR